MANTLIDLKPYITSQDSFLKSHMIFLSLMHSQFIEFIKLIIKMGI